MALKAIESATAVIGNVHLVYPKDEADRYIAHLKRERCLAMAMRCGIGAQFEHDKVIRFDHPFFIKRAEWLEKWRNRWLETCRQVKESV